MTYIDIDSTYRDRILYPNPCDMQIERSTQVRDNMNNARNIICDAIPSFTFDSCKSTNDSKVVIVNIKYPCYIGNYLEIIDNDHHYFFKITSVNNDYITVDKPVSKEFFNKSCVFKLRTSLPVHPMNGCKCKIENDIINGAVTEIKIINSGTDYKLGEELKVIGGDNNCIIRVNGVSDTKISSLKIVNPGSGYHTGQYTVSGSGMGCTITVQQTGVRVNSDISFSNKDVLFSVGSNVYPILGKFDNCIIVRNNNYIRKGNDYEIVEFTEDGVKDMKPVKNQYKEVEISLINLSIPNINFVGKNLNDYSYIFVEFYSGSTRKTAYQSNNPNLQNITFKCLMNKANEQDNYIRLCGLNSIKTQFNTIENITFKIKLPNGKVVEFSESDNKPPQRPNENMQINATFYLRTVSN